MIKKYFSLSSLAILAVLLTFSSCQKDESVLNDYDLFGRLQGGTGTWRVTEIQTFENNVPSPTITTTIPEQEIIHHFYIRSFEAFGILIDEHAVTVYTGGSLTKTYTCEAEKERVVYRDGEIFGGTVFTVEKSTPNKQIWNYSFESSTTRITFEKCNCEVPFVAGGETGG